MYQQSPASAFVEMAKIVKPDYVLAVLMSTFDGTTGEVIAIEWGDKGYRKTDCGRQTREWVEQKNADAGIDPATATAYGLCSLFGRWANYSTTLDDLREALSKKTQYTCCDPLHPGDDPNCPVHGEAEVSHVG